MSNQDEEFYKKLLMTFKIEADEHLKNLTSGLIELEKSPPSERMQFLEIIYRETHTLKGASRSVNLIHIEKICHLVESIFSGLKDNNIVLVPDIFNVLHDAFDFVSANITPTGKELSFNENKEYNGLVNVLSEISRGKFKKLEKSVKINSGHFPIKKASSEEIPAEDPEEIKEEATGNITSAILEVEKKEPIENISKIKPEVNVNKSKIANSDFLRISNHKLNELMIQIEELQTAKLTVEQSAIELDELNMFYDSYNLEKMKISSDLRKIQNLKNSLGDDKNLEVSITTNQFQKVMDFIDWSSEFNKNLQFRIDSLEKSFYQFNLSFRTMVDNILGDLKKIQLFPFSLLLEGFPKLIRDISISQGKEVEWLVKGSEIEVDKRIMDEIKDPLVHIIRNCIYHGLESPEERIKKRKHIKGKISFNIFQLDAGTIEIRISDDGGGINFEKVKSTILNLGLVKSNELDMLSEEELIAYLTHSGVSTASYVSDISGRGLGLAIVKEKIEKINGDLTIRTKANVGTEFIITIPVNMSTFRGTIIEEADQQFIIPSNYIEQVIRINSSDISSIENKETIQFKDKAVSLVRLADVLGVPLKKDYNTSKMFYVVIITSSKYQIAYLVDEIIKEHEILVKSLGGQLQHVNNVAGGTILGGKVVLILNIPDLIRSTISLNSNRTNIINDDVSSESKSKNRVLIAEDSITARTLLKNVVQTAGYDVTLAVDGMDALTKLKTNEFDLVITDIEMPRMNGFELTENIRSNSKLAEMPVILVTSLDSREDRERGIDVGASAYIIKGNFDQFHLIDVIKRLI